MSQRHPLSERPSTQAGFYRRYKILVPLFSKSQAEFKLRNWPLVLGISGPVQSDTGMVLNLSEVDKIVKRVVMDQLPKQLRGRQAKSCFEGWVKELQSTFVEHHVHLMELTWGSLVFDGSKYSCKKSLILNTKCFHNSKWMILPVRVQLWQKLLIAKSGFGNKKAGLKGHEFLEELDMSLRSAIQLQDMTELEDLCKKHSIVKIEARSEDRSIWIQAVGDFAS